MRTLCGVALLLAMSVPASAQVTLGGTTGGTGGTVPSGSPSFFAGPLVKPDYSALSNKAAFLPAAPNLQSMMPSWSGLQNTMMLRNTFTGPSMSVQFWPAPQPAMPPMPKKKLLPWQQ
jgi:hypothetical protein